MKITQSNCQTTSGLTKRCIMLWKASKWIQNTGEGGCQPALYKACSSVWHPHSNEMFPNTCSKLPVAQLSDVPILPSKSRAQHLRFPFTRSAESSGVTSWPPLLRKISASSHKTGLSDLLSALLPSSGRFHSP